MGLKGYAEDKVSAVHEIQMLNVAQKNSIGSSMIGRKTVSVPSYRSNDTRRSEMMSVLLELPF